MTDLREKAREKAQHQSKPHAAPGQLPFCASLIPEAINANNLVDPIEFLRLRLKR
jgi:hypothetical protein